MKKTFKERRAERRAEILGEEFGVAHPTPGGALAAMKARAKHGLMQHDPGTAATSGVTISAPTGPAMSALTAAKIAAKQQREATNASNRAAAKAAVAASGVPLPPGAKLSNNGVWLDANGNPISAPGGAPQAAAAQASQGFAPDGGGGYGGGSSGGGDSGGSSDGGGGGGAPADGGGGGYDGSDDGGGQDQGPYTTADAAFDQAGPPVDDMADVPADAGVDDAYQTDDPFADASADGGGGGTGTARLSYTAEQDQGDEVMGDDLLDDSRIFIPRKHQITDDEPGAISMPASVHRGSDYLQQYEIPLGLRQAGIEGGSIVPEEKISVFGAAKKAMKDLFSGYWHGVDIVGAAIAHQKTPPRAGFAVKPSARPGVRPIARLVLSKPKHGDNKSSIANARTAGKRAVSVGEKLLKTLATTKVKGEAFGAGPTAQVKGALAAVQVKQLANRAIAAGKDTLKHADKHEKLVRTNDTRVKTGAQHGKQATHIRGCAPSSVLGADDMSVYGPHELALLDHLSADPNRSAIDVLGAFQRILGDDATSDAATNMAPDGSADPTAAAAGIGSPPTSAPPLQAGVDYTPDPGPQTDTNFYSSDPSVAGVPLPDGAVLYDGTQRIPFAGVASMSRIQGQVPGLDAPEGGYQSGFELHDDGWYWWWAQAYNDGVAVDLRWKRFGDMNAVEMQKESIQHKWGPLMGDPNKGWPAGLRLDVAKGQWFWYRDKAPAWATAADDQLRLNQAILDYKAQVAAAAADAAAQAAQQKLDAAQADAVAKQQAAEDAAQQHQIEQQEAAAASQANIQAQQDAAAQQAAAAQAQVESQRYAAQVQAESSARIAEMQAAAELQAQQDEADAAAQAAADAGSEPGAGAPDDQEAALAAVQAAGSTGVDDSSWAVQAADEVTGAPRMSFRDRRDAIKDRR